MNKNIKTAHLAMHLAWCLILSDIIKRAANNARLNQFNPILHRSSAQRSVVATIRSVN